MTLDLAVYVVTSAADVAAIDAAVEAARGGASLVQLRDKDVPDAAFVEHGRALKTALAPFGVPLIVNDRLDAARAIGADGLHVGQSDTSAVRVRAVLGPTAIVGLSIENHAQLGHVDREAVTYLGAGPVFGTATKPDHAPPIGLDGLAAICRNAAHPVVAIGGLSLEHVGAVKAAGGDGIAVVTAVMSAPDPEAATRELVHAWRHA